MRVLARFLVVIVLLVGSFLTLMLATELFQRRQSASILARAAEIRETSLHAALASASAPLAAFGDGLRAGVRPTAVGTGPRDFGSIRIGNSPGAVILGGPEGASEVRVDPDFPHSLAKMLADRVVTLPLDSIESVFFLATADQVAECRTGICADGTGEVRFAVGRLWSASVLDGLAQQTGGSVRIEFTQPIQPGITGEERPQSNVRTLPLTGPRDDPIAWISVNFDAHTTEQLRVVGAQKLMLLLGFSLVVMIVLAFAMTRWIARPLNLIGQSLEAQDAAPLKTLLASRAEFGQFAQLIKTTLDQKAELGSEIAVRKKAEAAFMESVEERLRLSRDLHDGVIQSIYAAGLTLEGITRLIEKDPVEAKNRLERCLHGLNDTIAELRTYLIRSGETPTKRSSLSEEFNRMAETLRAGHTAEIALEIVEDAAARLDPEASMQLLLIGREAISNALRHGRARTVAVTLRPENDRVVAFEVRDDGSGLPPGDESEGRGHGLANMTSRAEELGGSLDIESRPGVGTRVRVELPVKAQTGT